MKKIVALSLCLVFISCASQKSYFAKGHVGPIFIQNHFDSAIAKYFLERQVGNQRFDDLIYDFTRNQSLTSESEHLGMVSLKTSTDFATLLFARSQYIRHQLFLQQYFALVQNLLESKEAKIVVPSDLVILLVPGFQYKSDRTTGADLEAQRTILERYGFRVERVDVDESGLIEENSEIIARTIERHRLAGRKILLASVSKGSLETMVALGRKISPQDAEAVKVWVSVGGLLKGTYLSEEAETFPNSLLVKFIFFAKGIHPRIINELSRSRISKVYSDIILPKSIKKISIVPVPFSRNLSSEVVSRYNELKKYGPNDGVSLLADQLLPDSLPILEVGLDHFFRDPRMDLKTLAIAILATKDL